MYCENSTSTSGKPMIEVRLEKSLAYEMINDFGADAYHRVIADYHANMVEKLAVLSAITDIGSVLWQLQSIRNCSAQLGVMSVVQQCDELKGQAMKGVLSRRDSTRLWVTVDASIRALKLLCGQRAA